MKLKINQYIELKLENNNTILYVNDERFLTCMHLFIPIFENVSENYNKKSIDDYDKHSGDKISEISPETEFWGHCSNIQAWVEHNYNTQILHRSIAFPLLKRLTELGDPIAKKIFKEEVAIRYTSDNVNVKIFLENNGYLKDFSTDELSAIGIEKQNWHGILIHYYKGNPIFYFENNAIEIRTLSLNPILIELIQKIKINLMPEMLNYWEKHNFEINKINNSYTLSILEYIYRNTNDNKIKSKIDNAIYNFLLVQRKQLEYMIPYFNEMFGIYMSKNVAKKLGYKQAKYFIWKNVPVLFITLNEFKKFMRPLLKSLLYRCKSNIFILSHTKIISEIMNQMKYIYRQEENIDVEIILKKLLLSYKN